jgi:hypothetical protein
MFWIILSLLGVGAGAAYLNSQGEGTSRQPPKAPPKIGAGGAGNDPIPPAVQRVIDVLANKLGLHGVPPAGVRYEARLVVFVYNDPRAADKAGDLLPQSLEIDAKMVRFVTITAAAGVGMGGGDMIGGDAPPDHGRTAKCKPPGGFFRWVAKAINFGSKAVFKGAATTFLGPAGGKLANEVSKLQAHLMEGGAKASGEKSPFGEGKIVMPSRDWINAAPNEVVLAWGVLWVHELETRAVKNTKENGWDVGYRKMRAAGLGITLDILDGEEKAAAALVFRYFLATKSSCVSQHYMQALAILRYGGVGAVMVVEDNYKKGRPKVNGKPVPFRKWHDLIVKRLVAYRESQGAAVGGDVPSDAALRAELLDGEGEA